MSFKQEKTPKPDPRLPQKINQTRFGFMASSVSMSESVFSNSLIRLMLCLKKFSHKTLRNSNINTLQRKQSNEFYLGTMLPSCQRMRFAIRVNRDCNCGSTVSFQEILSSTSSSHPTPQQLLITSTSVQRSP